MASFVGMPNIKIRGASSVTAGNEPLYVVDGIPVTTDDLSSNGAPTNPLADINMNDIENIQILKTLHDERSIFSATPVGFLSGPRARMNI